MEDTFSEEKLAEALQFDKTPFMGPNGQMDARMVFTHALFFSDGATLEGQMRGLETLAMLAQDVEEHISVMEPPVGGLVPWDLDAFLEVGKDVITQAFQGPEDDRDFDIGFHGTADGTFSAFGGSVAAAPPFFEGDVDLNLLETSTTLMWDAENTFSRQRDRLLAAAERLKPTFGISGFGLLFDRSGPSTSSIARMVPVMQRFPGLHNGLDISFLAQATAQLSQPDRYYTINWLTVICNEMLEQLPNGALDTLPSSCPVYQYDGGTVIQAGPHPQLGDTNRGVVLENYRSVEAVLSSLRFEDYPVGILPVPAPRDSHAETLTWVRRFGGREGGKI